jgi:hypothetical protein
MLFTNPNSSQFPLRAKQSEAALTGLAAHSPPMSAVRDDCRFRHAMNDTVRATSLCVRRLACF